MNKTITDIINGSIGQQQSYQIVEIKRCLDLLFPYICASYEHSRECVQHAIGELHRVPDAAQICMLRCTMEKLRTLFPRFSNVSSKSLSYIHDTPELDVRQIIDRIAPILSGAQKASALNMVIADSLTLDERRFFSNFVNELTSRYGVQTEWSKNIIENHLFYFNILYPICVKDDVMDLYFDLYYNFLDRLSTSGHYQEMRDCAENLLMIGHDRGMLPESYFGACRAYTVAHNVIGGLFFINFALYCLERSTMRIPQRLAFDLLWQYLKIMRESRYANLTSIDEIITMFDALGCNEYDVLSINHTALSIRLMSGDKTFKDRAIDFLNKNREAFFSNLSHSAMPWLILIRTYHTKTSGEEMDELSMYEAAAKSALEQNGNEKYLTLIGEDEHIEKHLKEELVKLQSTRNTEDFAHDNYTALMLAKKLITKSVRDDNPEGFILAMRPKCDFTFVMKDIPVTSVYAQLKIEDVDGNQCVIPYDNMNNLPLLMDADDSDIVVWIGKGTDSYYAMKLIRGAYSFDKLECLNEVNVKELQENIISRQYYQKTYKPKDGPIYVKSKDELEHESMKIKEALSKTAFEMPNVSYRCLIAKDIEVASIPHQLIVDTRTGNFIGEMMPSCNIISTELLIKSNFEEQLSENYTKSMWLPIESGEFTFEEIKGRINDVLDQNGFSIYESVVPDEPISADLNIVCAHGGRDIGKTQWFYANDKPIVETRRIVGSGCVLVLFVCHSGSMFNNGWDNAMHTIVKWYFRMGYSAVVAPMWSLATEILPCWLSQFMTSINNHEYVIDAVYKANMAVKEEFVSVSAWGCMHLFGNPYVQISDKPRIEI